jgi:hypothetical protein
MNLRRAAKADANQREVVTALRAAGGYWIHLGHPVDGIAGYRSKWVPVELKDGRKPPSARELTDDQLAFVRDCEAYRMPVIVATSAEDLLSQLRKLSGAWA